MIFEKKNVYMDRLIQANQEVFKEAMNMSNAMKELFFELGERDGWFTARDNTRDFEKAKAIAHSWEFLYRGCRLKTIMKSQWLNMFQ